MQYERVRAEDIQPGDRVARARTHEFRLVRRIDHHAKAVRLTYDTNSSDRPRREALWWKEA